MTFRLANNLMKFWLRMRREEKGKEEEGEGRGRRKRREEEGEEFWEILRHGRLTSNAGDRLTELRR